MSKKNADGSAKPVVVDASNVNREATKLAFEAYDVINAEVEAMKVALEAKITERSDSVKAILTAAGGFKGPFNRQGGLVKIVQRDALYFLRGRSDAGSFEV